MSSAGAVLGGHRIRLGSNNGSLSRPDLQTLSAGCHARGSAAPYRMDVRMGSSGKFFVGGNWKANGTKESVSKLVSGLNSAQFPSEVDVIVAPTFLHLPYVVENISSRYQVSAQNCWVGRAGAFTGEVRDLGSQTILTCVMGYYWYTCQPCAWALGCCLPLGQPSMPSQDFCCHAIDLHYHTSCSSQVYWKGCKVEDTDSISLAQHHKVVMCWHQAPALPARWACTSAA